jgi:hypothetical protein
MAFLRRITGFSDAKVSGAEYTSDLDDILNGCDYPAHETVRLGVCVLLFNYIVTYRVYKQIDCCPWGCQLFENESATDTK